MKNRIFERVNKLTDKSIKYSTWQRSIVCLKVAGTDCQLTKNCATIDQLRRDPILINVQRGDPREAIKLLPAGANGEVKWSRLPTFNPMNGTSLRSLRVV